MNNDLQLKDIHLPENITWQFNNLTIALIVLLIFSSLLFVYFLYKKLTKTNIKKTAFKIISEIKNNEEINNIEKLKQLSIILRRVAISTQGRLPIASLTGESWLEYLDTNLPDKPFTNGIGKVFFDIHYRASNENLELEPIIKLCEDWISKNT